MNKQSFIVIAVFLVIIFFIGAVDIGLNIFSLIPGIGPAFEGISEAVLELLQFTITGIGLFVVSQLDGE